MNPQYTKAIYVEEFIIIFETKDDELFTLVSEPRLENYEIIVDVSSDLSKAYRFRDDEVLKLVYNNVPNVRNINKVGVR